MSSSLHQHLITFGLTPRFLYQGTERLLPHRSEEVHVWAVQLLGGHPTALVSDRYRSTRNEYEAVRAKETSLTEQYMISFTERMNRLLALGGATADYGAWLDDRGVAFGVNTEADWGSQEFWKARFDTDVRCFKEFQKVICGADRAREFLSATASL